jgi:anti-anti-sigma factor
MSAYQHLDVTELGDTILVCFKQRHALLDFAVPSDIANELDELADQRRCRKVIIDMSGVEYVSSLVLGLLVMLRKQAMSKGGQVVLCGLSPVVREMFDRTMLSRSWDIRESKADAFAVLA